MIIVTKMEITAVTFILKRRLKQALVKQCAGNVNKSAVEIYPKFLKLL